MKSRCQSIADGDPVIPRSCPVCRLGPCHQNDDRLFKNGTVTFEGRRNGMSERDDRGSYVALSVMLDGSGKTINVKLNCSEASLLGELILRNT